MKPASLLPLLAALLLAVHTHAQQVEWEEFAADYLQQEFSDEEQAQLSALGDYLLELHRQPIDINRAQAEDLLQLPFITPPMADSILSYRRRQGALLSLEELAFVKGISHQARRWAHLFLTCGSDPRPPTPAGHRPSHDCQHLLAANAAIPLYLRAGFGKYSKDQLAQSPNKAYQGPPLAATLRYRGQWSDRLEWGLTGQTDEGEPIGRRGNHLADYQSAFLLGRGHGLLRRWAVGDYRMHLGLGLTVGQGMWNNALSLLDFPRNTRQGIVKHSGTDETHFLRGAAATLGLGRWQATFFASHRRLDATIQDGRVSTWLTTGLHRTALELQRKGNLACTAWGGQMAWQGRHLTLGLNALRLHYGHPFTTGTALYRRYYLQGSQAANYSVHYALHWKNISLSGEEATDGHRGWAALNRLHLSPTRHWAVSLVHRCYDKRYNAPMAFAYSLGGHVKNEHGLLGGVRWSPHRHWTCKAYADYAFHPYALYNATRSSQRWAALAQAEYTWQDHHALLLRYRLRNRETDNADRTALTPAATHSVRIQAHYGVGRARAVSTLDGVCHTATGKTRWGRMLSQRMSMALVNDRIRIGLMGALFHTADYATALHLYEPQLRYTFSFPACFYHGWRGVAMATGRWNRACEVGIKYAVTHLTNRSTIASGTQRIDSPTQQDIQCQWVWRF
ncbi:MAG: helix-hairpin-helix domain-containing protein [Bacteroidaceae bacterium]|nr:helix-hairpin-helix domain-containing protein [Bacteroidaceae bacterium]